MIDILEEFALNNSFKPRNICDLKSSPRAVSNTNTLAFAMATQALGKPILPMNIPNHRYSNTTTIDTP